MNQYLQLFLKRVSNSDTVPISLRNQGIFRHVIRICKLLHMNELEITVWSLHLEEIHWAMCSLSLDFFLAITAMQAKDYLNDEAEVEMYVSRVNEEYAGFKEAYEKWVEKRENGVRLAIKEINRQYNKYRLVSSEFTLAQPSTMSFTVGPKSIDYNKSVEDLLKMNPRDANRPQAAVIFLLNFIDR
eukprot:TRINITY_DN5335_c0_g1_i3.p1 TRINITY_DN5335_c0_g1~~TRINITY_DN5335_c0_g1_i3.p1  ORF type:complete len:186 (-),score=38.12 TRINITY_DN5335_c0_g1_i3:573-1130(-)